MTDKMKALVVQPDKVAKVVEVSVPKLKPEWVLVKTSAVALNPTDWKHIEKIAEPGSKVGCDFVGIVEEVGDKVTSKVKKGDRIAGFVHGANSVDFDDGAFGDYLIVKDGLFLHPPSSMTDEEAATLGVGVSTVGQSLYQSLHLPLPTAPASQSFPVLIYGGSTATGALAIQYAKLSGAQVITTASKRNHEYLKSLGADACVDYNDSDAVDQVKKLAPNLHLALDNIAMKNTAKFCSDALAPSTKEQKSVVTFLLDMSAPSEDVESRKTLGYTAFGRPFKWFGNTIGVQEGHYEFAREFWAISEKLFAEGKVKVHRPDLREGGLEGILKGLDDLKNDRVSGYKLVYKI